MKIVLLIICIILLPLTLICQEKHPGLSVGINLDKWYGDDDLFAQGLSINL